MSISQPMFLMTNKYFDHNINRFFYYLQRKTTPQQQNTGHTQNNGAVLIVNTIKTAPFFCVCPVHH
jgi:hypothetical protein